MLQQPVSTYFLYVKDVDLGSWVHTILGFGVSPRIVAAMNHILKQDGILAFIGTRSEFGQYLTDLKRDHERDMLRCWISFPASTVMSKLGLCLNTQLPGSPFLDFYGSPLLVATFYLMEHQYLGTLERELEQIEFSIRSTGLYRVENTILNQYRPDLVYFICRLSLDEAISYVKENTYA
jgi:hypothetical protein